MNAHTLLASKGIAATSPALFITAEEAIQNILDFSATEEINLDLNKLTREELDILISSYGECVMNYHPESYHQERAALIRNFEMLLKCGLEQDDFAILDFS